MKFFLIPIIVVAICQTVKFATYFLKEKEISFQKVIWEGFWVGKFPSSHSALLASSLYLVSNYVENKAVVSFAFFVSALLLYGLLEDKKRHEIFETYVAKSADKELRKIAEERILHDFNGHTFFEIGVGLFIGTACSFVLDYLVF